MICYFCKNEIPDLGNSCIDCKASAPGLVYVVTYDNRAVVRFRLKEKEWRWIWYFAQQKSVLNSPGLLKNVLSVPKLIDLSPKNVVEKTHLYLVFL